MEQLPEPTGQTMVSPEIEGQELMLPGALIRPDLVTSGGIKSINHAIKGGCEDQIVDHGSAADIQSG